MLSNTVLNNEQEMTPLPTYRRGGKVKGKMQPAHFSPGELRILDHLQGGTETCKKTGMRCYSHLEELLKNPHIRSRVLSFAREHHADGHMIGDEMHQEVHGSPQEATLEQLVELILMKMRHDPSSVTQEELQFLKSQGRDGDRELANIGPETSRLFDHMAGHRTQNPRTGLHEYWSLGSVLGGLWNSVKGKAASAWGAVKEHAPGMINSAAQALLPHAGKIAGNAINARFGEDSSLSGALNGLTDLGQKMASKGINHLAGGQTSNYGQNLGDSLGGSFTRLAQGDHAGKAFGEGFNQWGENQGGLAGDFAKTTGQNLIQGKNLGSSLVNSAKQTAGWGQNGNFFEGMHRQNVGQAALGGAMQGLGHLAGGGHWKHAAGKGIQSFSKNLGPNGFSNAMNHLGQGMENGSIKQGLNGAGSQALAELAPNLTQTWQHNHENLIPAFNQNAQYSNPFK